MRNFYVLVREYTTPLGDEHEVLRVYLDVKYAVTVSTYLNNRYGDADNYYHIQETKGK